MTTINQADIAQAGMLGPSFEHLGRPTGGTSWPVPRKVQVDGDQLAWEQPTGWDPTSVVAPSVGLLDAFVKLGDATGQQVADFASQYGLLLNRADQRGHGSKCPTCDPPYNVELHPLHGAEPIEATKRLARDLVRLLNIAATVHLGDEPAAQHWDDLENLDAKRSRSGNVHVAIHRGHAGEPFPSGVMNDVGRPLYVLAVIGHHWLFWAHVSVTLAARGDGIELGFATPSLSAALAVEYSQTIGRKAGLAACSHCGAWYAPKRKPRADQANYCTTCRESGVPQRMASRHYRARAKT